MASFRDKLARLGQPPATHVEPDVPPPRTELDELRNAIAKIMARPAEPRVIADPSATSLPFARVDTPSGPLYQRVLRHSAAHRVGRFPVLDAWHVDPAMLALLALDPALSALDPKGFVYLDTETTGLAGGTGTVPFLIGAAYFEDGSGDLVLEQLLLRQLGEEAPMLERFSVIANRATAFVSYNGKSFDLPLLRTRLVLSRLPELAPKPHLDLVHVARRVHKKRLGVCKLVTLEEHVLGFLREGDVPGGEVVARYRHFLRSGDDSALLGVVDHNAWDIVALAALVGLYGAPLEGIDAVDLAEVARTLRRAKDFERARTLVDAAIARGGGAEALRASAEIARAKGERDRAVSDYEALLATVDEPAARLALAKLYEHHVRAPAQALRLVEQGTSEDAAPAERRRARLAAKVARDVQIALPGLSGVAKKRRS